MKKVFLVFMVGMISLASCKQNKSNEEEANRSEVAEQSTDEIVEGIETNQKGDKLEYTFNNTKNTATFIINGGEKIEMVADSARASGANYKNDSYSYTNWHGITELKQGDRTIFYYNSNLVESTVKNKDGKVLDMKFNNSNNTALFVFNGETIELKGDTTASGIRYSNKHYIFTEHQGKMELLKDNKVIFTNQE